MEHVGANTGEQRCQVEHVGLVVSGRAKVLMADGTEIAALNAPSEKVKGYGFAATVRDKGNEADMSITVN